MASAGRPRKPAYLKEREGNPGKRKIMVLDFDSYELPLSESTFPGAPAYMGEEQRGSIEMPLPKLDAEKIMRTTYNWLQARHCEHLINPQLLERYAMAQARWQQAEQLISKHGVLCADERAKKLMRKAPWVEMADMYCAQATKLWDEIFGVVRENCMTEYKGSAQQSEDIMEQLLSS